MKYTAKMLRKNAKEKAKKPCVACGGHQSIAHQHHIIPLKKCAQLLAAECLSDIKVPLVWLCPNCHAYLHKMLKGQYYLAIGGLEKGVYQKLLEIDKKGRECEDDILDEIVKNAESNNH